MTMQSFHYLNEIEQADLVTEKGTFICERVDGDTIYNLYQIDAFFVEYCFFSSDDREAQCRIFKSPPRFHPYREMMQGMALKA